MAENSNDIKSKKSDKKSPDNISRKELFEETKFQVYQQAVQKVYKEGKISPNEEMVLESMRDTLEIPYEVHEKILEMMRKGDEE